MEQSGGRLLAEARFHCLHDALEIAAQLLVCMVRRLDWNVLPMVAKIEYQQIELGQEMLPVWIVGVRGKAVAVGQQQPHPVRVAMPSHANSGAVVEDDIEGHARNGNFEMHGVFLTVERVPPTALARQGL